VGRSRAAVPAAPRSSPRAARDLGFRALVGLRTRRRASTSPQAPRTHWDQIYLPLLHPVAAQAGDELAFTLESETGGDETGIEVRWTVHHARDGRLLDEQALSIGAGWLG
jgi:hypothetical protein